jgi:hypothetical protein
MPNHFAAIGFLAPDSMSLRLQLEEAAGNAQTIALPGGSYLRWESGNGAEVWFQLKGGGSLVGATPYFSGKSRISASITGRVRRKDDSRFDMAFHAWADPAEGGEGKGLFPFVFECPDGYLFRNIATPVTTVLSLAAFAHELEVHESEAAYYSTQTGEIRIASRSFIPSGLFSSDLSPLSGPLPYAVFTGHVTEVRTVRNPLTGSDFVWALTETAGGSIDVVVEPALHTLPIRFGSVISGSFWLCGRLSGALPSMSLLGRFWRTVRGG